MKFITLTDSSNNPVIIRTKAIEYIYSYECDSYKSIVKTGHGSIQVKDTIQIIEQLIKGKR